MVIVVAVASPAIEVDRSQWPILLARVNGQPTDEEFEAYLAELERALDSGVRYASVVSTARNAPMTRARHAKMQAKWIAEREALIAERCAAVAFVLPSAVMRGVLRAILAMQRMPSPYKVFEDEAEGIAWVREQLG